MEVGLLELTLQSSIPTLPHRVAFQVLYGMLDISSISRVRTRSYD